jgi:hypothetical protein
MASVEISENTVGGLAGNAARTAKVTAGTSAISLPPPQNIRTARYVKIINTHATAVVLVDLNQNPTQAAADPPSASQYGLGQPIGPGERALLPIVGPVTTLRVLSDTATTVIWVCWIP